MHQGISRQYYERARHGLLPAPSLMQWIESQCHKIDQNVIGPPRSMKKPKLSEFFSVIFICKSSESWKH